MLIYYYKTFVFSSKLKLKKSLKYLIIFFTYNKCIKFKINIFYSKYLLFNTMLKIK